MFLPQEGKVVNLVPPAAKSSAAVSTAYVDLDLYDHVDFVLQFGSCSSIAADKVSMKQATSVSGSSSAALVCTRGYYHNRTALGSSSVANDTLGHVTKSSMSSSGAAFALASNSVSNQIYVIPVDANMLSSGKKSAGVGIATLGCATVGILAILSAARYQRKYPPSAL